MKNNTFAAFLLTLVLSVGIALGQERTMTVTIADGKIACPSDETKQCLFYRQADSSQWFIVTGNVRGFKFREGFTQTIRVKYTPKMQATNEPGSLDWVLFKTLSSKKTAGKTIAEAFAQFESRKPPVLAGRNWTLVSIDGTAVETPDLTLRFDGTSNRFGVRVCNQIGGRYEQDGAKLKLTSMVSTQMACREPLDSTERRFQAALAKVDSVKTSGEKLLMLGGAATVLEFVERLALEDIRWGVTEIGGKKVVTSGDVPYIQLTKSALSGFSGCNQLFGKYTLNGSTLKFTELAMTKMACTEDGLMEIEFGMFNALEKADRFEIKNGVFTLFAGSRALMRLNALSN
ncbi:MAG: META domain-containing protein [Acidobacteria bacterium]|nr:META domain-containing protein [Acidobacteriota bacterium]